MRFGHFDFADQIGSAVFTPHFAAWIFLARIMPCRFSLSPATAIGTPDSHGCFKHSTEAKKLFKSEWIIILLTAMPPFEFFCYVNYTTCKEKSQLRIIKIKYVTYFTCGQKCGIIYRNDVIRR